MPTSNNSSLLDSEDKPGTNPESINRPNKPPPIFVKGVGNIQPLITLLNEHANNLYEIKVLRNEQGKIQPKSSEAYSKLVKQLEIKQI